MGSRNVADALTRCHGLDGKQLAFRQIQYVGPNPGRVGFRSNELVLRIHREWLEMNPHEFQIHRRLYYNVGDRVVLNIIRDCKHLEFPMTLPVHPAD